jgi:hypothetical protein
MAEETGNALVGESAAGLIRPRIAVLKMMKRVWDYRGQEVTIDLVPGISEQDFLTVLCSDYEGAARFILDWAKVDQERSAEFLARFFWKVFQDLDVNSSGGFMNPRDGERTGLRPPRSSVCRVAFMRFCELLYESPELVRRVQRTARYSELPRDDIFPRRETNGVALSRGIVWVTAASFGDPEPIPDFYRQRELARRAEADRRRELQDQAERQEREKKKAERLLRSKEIEEESKRRNALREEFKTQSVHNQLVTLASSTKIPLRVFQFNPAVVTEKDLEQLDNGVLTALQDRIGKQWKPGWKALNARIRKTIENRTRQSS